MAQAAPGAGQQAPAQQTLRRAEAVTAVAPPEWARTISSQSQGEIITWGTVPVQQALVAAVAVTVQTEAEEAVEASPAAAAVAMGSTGISHTAPVVVVVVDMTAEARRACTVVEVVALVGEHPESRYRAHRESSSSRTARQSKGGS